MQARNQIMRNFTSVFSHHKKIPLVKIHMSKIINFTRQFSHEMIDIKLHMRNITCDFSHMKIHMWNFICEISHVKFPWEISQVNQMWTLNNYMWNFTIWNFTCETHEFHIKKLIVFLELHMWKTWRAHKDPSSVTDTWWSVTDTWRARDGQVHTYNLAYGYCTIRCTRSEG